MALESWSMGIARIVITGRPHAWVSCVPLFVVTAFAVMNLAAGLMASAMRQSHHEGRSGATDICRDEALRCLAAIESRLADLGGRE